MRGKYDTLFILWQNDVFVNRKSKNNTEKVIAILITLKYTI